MSGVFDAEIQNFWETVDTSDVYELDQYWLLFYQLFFDGKHPNPYQNGDTFDVLKAEDVSFIQRSGYDSAAEKAFLQKKVQKIFSAVLDTNIAIDGIAKS